MRIFENLNVRFVQNRTRAYVFSGILLVAGIASLVTRGVELGIDFTGGMEFVVEVLKVEGSNAWFRCSTSCPPS